VDQSLLYNSSSTSATSALTPVRSPRSHLVARAKLARLVDRAHTLARLVDRAHTLARLVDRAHTLARLVDRAHTLARLLDRAHTLARLVDRAHTLARLLDRAHTLARLVDRAHTLARLVDHAHTNKSNRRCYFLPHGATFAILSRYRLDIYRFCGLRRPLGTD